MAADVFISYAFEDLAYLRKLETHLAALKRQGILQTWHAERVVPGENWNDALKRYLETARVILLLVSADYVHSDISFTQMESAIRRSRQGKACVIPVLVRPCFRQGLAMEGLFKLPENAIPISQWQNEDAAWATVVRGIYKAIVELRRGETASPMSMPPHEEPPAMGTLPGYPPTPARISVQPPPSLAPGYPGPKPSIPPHSVSSHSIPPQSVLAHSVLLPPPEVPATPPVEDSAFPYKTLVSVIAALAMATWLVILAIQFWPDGSPETADAANGFIPLPPPGAGPSQPAGKITADPITPQPAPTVYVPLGGFGQPEKGWVEAYGAAIGGGNVDRILELHVLPTPYFFAARNQSEAQLRKRYQGWYDSDGRNRRTGFDSCSLVDVAQDGSRAVRCTTYVDPPFKNSPSRVPTCLVFRSDGKLLARTETASSSDCPPR